MTVSATRDLPLGLRGDISNFPRTILTQAINQINKAEGLWNLVSASPCAILPYHAGQEAGVGVGGNSHSLACLKNTSFSLYVGWEFRILRVKLDWREGKSWGLEKP